MTRSLFLLLAFLTLATTPATKARIYTTPGYWPLADSKDLPAIQTAIAARAASPKTQ